MSLNTVSSSLRMTSITILLGIRYSVSVNMDVLLFSKKEKKKGYAAISMVPVAAVTDLT